MDPLEQLAGLVRTSRFTVVLTGAGISTASGVPDYRSRGVGLWERYDPQESASIAAFRRDPTKFWAFYIQRFGMLARALPNHAHHALVEMEASGWIRGIVTQNIDMLHRKAGSRTVVELHGSIESARCVRCDRVYAHDEVVSMTGTPTCACGSPLKPGVVLFGEELPKKELRTAMEWAQGADLMIVAGSSLQVWPAAGLPGMTVESGGALAVVNDAETTCDDVAAVIVRGRVEEILPRLAHALKEQ